MEKETLAGMDFRSLNDEIKRTMRRSAAEVVKLGYLLRRMMEERLWDGQYACFDEYLETELHMDYTMANRFIGINKKYSVDGRSADIDTKWEGYSQAVLIEMLSMPPELEGQITPDMTVRQVREAKRQAREAKRQAKKETSWAEHKASQTEQETALAEQEVPLTGSKTPWTDQESETDIFPGQVGVEEWLAVMQKESSGTEEENRDEVLDVEYRELGAAEDIATSQSSSRAMGRSAEPQFPEAAQEELNEDMSEITDETAEVRRILKREQKTLDEYLSAGGLPERTVFRQKTLAAALEAMLQAMENREQEAGQEGQEPDQESLEEQPSLPALKNNTQRKEWLKSYKDWGLWYRDEHIGADYYKYDFENGARLIAEVFQEEANHFHDAYESCFLHLVGGPKPPAGHYGVGKWQRHEKYSRYPNSETELTEFLKEVQKEKG